MKKESKNRYETTRFNAIPKHQGTHPFVKGNEPPQELSARIPAYNTQGKDYKRNLPPVRDHRDIDISILAEVLQAVCPEFDISQLTISTGFCETKHVKFRFTDLTTLLKTLQQERILSVDDYNRKSIEYRYNREFNNRKYNETIKRSSNHSTD